MAWRVLLEAAGGPGGELAADVVQRVLALAPGFAGQVHLATGPQGAPAGPGQGCAYLGCACRHDPDPARHGVAVYHSPGSPAGRRLAHTMLDAVLASLGGRARADWLGVWEAAAPLCPGAEPAVRLELGNLGHGGDAALLGEAAARQRVAEACVLALAAGLGAPFAFPVNPLLPDRFDLRVVRPVRAARLERVLRDTPLAGLGRHFVTAGGQYGVDPAFLCAHALLDSAWGQGDIARHKRNLMRVGADGRDPFTTAWTFANFADSIPAAARCLHRVWLNPVHPLFRGANIRGLNVSYRPDPGWGPGVVAILNRLVPEWQPGAAPAPGTLARGWGSLRRWIRQLLGGWGP